MVIGHFIFPVSAVAYVVTYKIGADANIGVTVEGIGASKRLGVLESRDDKCEAIIFSAPAVGLVAKSYKIGPGYDEALRAY